MGISQCLRCNQSCSPTNIFCDSCRSFLQHSLSSDRSRSTIVDSANTQQIALSPKTTVPDTDGLGNTSTPFPAADTHDPQPGRDAYKTQPLPGSTAYTNMVEQTLHRLNDAARRIDAIEDTAHRRPHPSHLSPLRDISSKVQHHSTPMPRAGHPEAGLGEQTVEMPQNLPDLWPWLGDAAAPNDNDDIWSDGNDPFSSRSIPHSTDSHDDDDQFTKRHYRQPAISQSFIPPTSAIPQTGKRSLLQASHLRVAFIFLAILAVLVLTVDSVLISVAFLHPHTDAPGSKGPPTLALSSSTARYGQTVTLQILHFSASARVYLTRDIDEHIKTNVDDPLVSLDKDGSARVLIYIDTAWNPGLHTIVAEDTATRYTVNVSLRIDAGPTRPSQFVINTTHLDLGAALVGANTIQPLTLHNSGTGTITWSASSNQPWLLMTPTHGVFSSSQMIEVAAQRSNLKPGTYSGQITFSSNVDQPVSITVEMTVRPLPTNAGAVLSITPAVLSFTAQDGGSDPGSQPLLVSNPGSQPLYWSIGNNLPNQNPLPGSTDTSVNWLTIDHMSGIVPPGETSSINISALSHSLLPALYLATLVFNVSSGHSALNNPQNVSLSLTVQPACGLILTTANLSFTSVTGNTGIQAGNQTLNFSPTASCSNPIDWHATSSASWLQLTPASGQLRPGTATTVGINTSNLKPGTYTATISVMTPMMTQSVLVQLLVQPPPLPTAPLMAASPLNLNFSTTLGQPGPAGQTVTITNMGSSRLTWRPSITIPGSGWLTASSTGGTIKPGQTAQLTVNVSASNLTPGNYTGQVILNGTDSNNVTAGGSPQIIAVNFTVFAPCTLAQLSPAALAFTSVQGGADPGTQSMTITATGNCSWPLIWKVSAGSISPWLHISSATGSLNTSGQANVLTVAPHSAGLPPGVYNAQATVTAIDAAGIQAMNGSQTIPITLTVTGFTLSGTVSTCPTAGCSTPTPLPAATLLLMNGSTQVATITADASGDFSFKNIPSGTYTISASGTDGAHVHYTGTPTVTISGNQALAIALLPG